MSRETFRAHAKKYLFDMGIFNEDIPAIMEGFRSDIELGKKVSDFPPFCQRLFEGDLEIYLKGHLEATNPDHFALPCLRGKYPDAVSVKEIE